MIFKQKLIEE